MFNTAGYGNITGNPVDVDEIKRDKKHSFIHSGGSRGGRCLRTTPPNEIQFFHFHIHFHQKVSASEVGTPPLGSAPPTGNSGSATELQVSSKTSPVTPDWSGMFMCSS